MLSDSHGQLDPRALDVFREAGVGHLIHAGDIGSHDVLLDLESVAPVTAVRGNTDPGFLGVALADRASVRLAGVRFAVVHEPEAMARWALPDDVRVAIVGHTHRARISSSGTLLQVNPGSVFRPRGPEGRTVALVRVNPATGQVEAQIVPLGSV